MKIAAVTIPFIVYLLLSRYALFCSWPGHDHSFRWVKTKLNSMISCVYIVTEWISHRCPVRVADRCVRVRPTIPRQHHPMTPIRISRWAHIRPFRVVYRCNIVLVQHRMAATTIDYYTTICNVIAKKIFAHFLWVDFRLTLIHLEWPVCIQITRFHFICLCFDSVGQMAKHKTSREYKERIYPIQHTDLMSFSKFDTTIVFCRCI